MVALAGVALVAAPLAGVAGAAPARTITLENIRYSPSSVTVSKGTTVRWVWRDGSIRHDVRFTSGGFKPSRLQSRGSHAVTFRKRGTFRFFCSVHPGDMKGRIRVR